MASVFERDRALHWKYPLDRALLDACAALLPGRHDFTAFTRTQTVAHAVRARRAHAPSGASAEGGVLEFWIEADSFMRHMVRILVGTMLGVAAGRMQRAESSPGC